MTTLVFLLMVGCGESAEAVEAPPAINPEIDGGWIMLDGRRHPPPYASDLLWTEGRLVAMLGPLTLYKAELRDTPQTPSGPLPALSGVDDPGLQEWLDAFEAQAAADGPYTARAQLYRDLMEAPEIARVSFNGPALRIRDHSGQELELLLEAPGPPRSADTLERLARARLDAGELLLKRDGAFIAFSEGALLAVPHEALAELMADTWRGCHAETRALRDQWLLPHYYSPELTETLCEGFEHPAVFRTESGS